MSEHLFADDVLFLQRFLKSGGLYAGKLDGIWGPLTDAGHEAFLAQSDDIAAELGEFDGRSERLIASLHLPAQRSARGLLARVRAAGIDARLVSGTRSYGEQNMLFRRGRFGNPRPRSPMPAAARATTISPSPGTSACSRVAPISRTTPSPIAGPPGWA